MRQIVLGAAFALRLFAWQAPADLAGTFHGTLKQLTKSEIVIENGEDQFVVIRRSHKTKFLRAGKGIKPSEIPLNVRVSVDATPDVDLKPVAIKLTVEDRQKSQ